MKTPKATPAPRRRTAPAASRASSPDAAEAGLSAASLRFVLHWGEMGTRWGVNRTVAQIHGLLYLSARPMHADELASTLGVARSNVSTSLRELQNWNLVRVVHLLGDRRDHFETSGDVWELFRTVVRERRAREFTPTMQMLAELLDSEELRSEPAVRRQRVAALLGIMQTLSAWADEMLRLEPETLMKIMKLGARIQTFVRGKTDA